MHFEDLKVLWDSQNAEPLYAVNQAGLHSILQSKSRKFRRRMFWRDVREIGIGIVVGAYIFSYGGRLMFGAPERLASSLNVKVPPTSSDLLALLIAGVLWFYYALHQYLGRKRQDRRERRFTASLHGELEREIARTEYEIGTTKHALWWAVLPVWAATCLFGFVVARLLDFSGWVVLAGMIFFLGLAVLDFVWRQRPIERELLPRKRELEALRDKLSSAEQ